MLVNHSSAEWLYFLCLLIKLDFVWRTRIPRSEICSRRRRRGDEWYLESKQRDTSRIFHSWFSQTSNEGEYIAVNYEDQHTLVALSIMILTFSFSPPFKNCVYSLISKGHPFPDLLQIPNPTMESLNVVHQRPLDATRTVFWTHPEMSWIVGRSHVGRSHILQKGQSECSEVHFQIFSKLEVRLRRLQLAIWRAGSSYVGSVLKCGEVTWPPHSSEVPPPNTTRWHFWSLWEVLVDPSVGSNFLVLSWICCSLLAYGILYRFQDYL